jgi:hypothetical protein
MEFSRGRGFLWRESSGVGLELQEVGIRHLHHPFDDKYAIFLFFTRARQSPSPVESFSIKKGIL